MQAIFAGSFLPDVLGAMIKGEAPLLPTRAVPRGDTCSLPQQLTAPVASGLAALSGLFCELILLPRSVNAGWKARVHLPKFGPCRLLLKPSELKPTK